MRSRSKFAASLSCINPKIESLEPRRLLTYTLNGTSGNDTIQMFYSGSTVEIYLNGNLTESTSSETNFVINGNDGNDSIDIQETLSNDHVTVNGGAGDDTIQVADSSFTSIAGPVSVSGGDGSDSVVVSDSIDSTGAPFYLDFNGMGYNNANHNQLAVNGDVETEQLTFGTAANYLYVGQTRNGLSVDMGAGNDTVNLGGGDSIIPTNLNTSTFTGGSGTDDFIVDDSANEPPGAPATYTIGATSIMNQPASGFETADLYAGKTDLEGFSNQIQITGNDGLSAINLNGTVAFNQNAGDYVSKSALSVGTPGSPVDFDNLSVPINVNVILTSVTINDQDANNSNNPWILYTTTANDTTQCINKGSYTLSLPTKFQGADYGNNDRINTINGGSTNDLFEVAGLKTFTWFNGDAGNDSLITTDFGGDNHVDDLAAIFNNVGCEFTGGPGTDFLDADDSGGGTGNDSYAIEDGELDMDNYSDSFGDRGLLFFDGTTEQVLFVADGGNNTIYFGGENQTTSSATLSGGDGNDTFIGATSSYLAGNSPVLIEGGDGTNQIIFDDSASNISQNYGVSGTSLWFDLNQPQCKVSFDTAIQYLELDTGEANSSITLDSKPAALQLNVYGNSGNDSFNVGGGDLDSNGWVNVFLNGGAGTNSITFNDSQDAYSASESETTQLNPGELDKGSVTVDFANIQSQTLDAPTNGSPTNVSQGSIINLNSTSIPTTIYGASGRYATINVGNPSSADLSPITATVTLVMGGAGGAVINDQNSTGDKSYTISSTQFTASSGQVVNFSGAGLTLNANGGNNAIAVTSTAAGQPIVVNANGGNDAVTIGGGNLSANLAIIPSINGGAGTDTLGFDDSTDPTFQTGSLAAASITYNGTYGFQTGMEAIKLETGTGGSTFNVNIVPLPIQLTGGSGADTFNIGNGNLDTNLTNNVIATGGGGANTLLIDDHLDTGNDTYNLSSNNFFFKGTSIANAKTVDASGFASYTISCNSGSNPIDIDGNTPVTVLGNAGVDSLDAEGTSSPLVHIIPNVTFDGGTGLDNVLVNTANAGAAVVRFTNTQDLNTIQIGSGGELFTGSGLGLAMTIKSLSFTGNASAYLDLNNNDMIWDYSGSTPISTVNNSITTARNNGAWNGAFGFTSLSAKNNSSHTTTLGAMEASDYKSIYGPSATFDGATIDNTAVLVKYTYYGDANFNGTVDGGDYARMDITFGKESSQGNIGGWINGDFNGDGRVDGSDYGLADLAFGAQTGPINPPPAAAPTSSPGQPGRGGIGPPHA